MEYTGSDVLLALSQGKYLYRKDDDAFGGLGINTYIFYFEGSIRVRKGRDASLHVWNDLSGIWLDYECFPAISDPAYKHGNRVSEPELFKFTAVSGVDFWRVKCRVSIGQEEYYYQRGPASKDKMEAIELWNAQQSGIESFLCEREY